MPEMANCVRDEETGVLWVPAAGFCPASMAYAGVIPIRYYDESPGDPLMPAEDALALLRSEIVGRKQPRLRKALILALEARLAENTAMGITLAGDE